ncbi:hypothetical protein [Salinarimonas soli]|uniref:Uncharacterized protein n=1 Tax=Salinarimonas soli TaxID=1638099 RepID=A0A5B2VGP2_9HYPH|nr:hypothetical protein [Salinarimonas soli]KAA2238054.1 hypothetical protein F0L46_07235 [Salinarimonas soli]
MAGEPTRGSPPVTSLSPVRRALAPLLRGLGLVLRGIFAAAILLQELVAFVGAPVWRAIAGLPFLAALADLVRRLPPYGVLAVLAVPFLVAEPLKIAGLYALGTGRIAWGVGLQVVGHAVSLLLVERILHAGLPQLLTLRWFAVIWGWFVSVRSAVGAWITAIGLRRLLARIRDGVVALAASIRRGILRLVGR